MKAIMDNNAPKGTKVVYAYLNAGWDTDIKKARENLQLNETYTVERTVEHGWHTEVYLQEVPGLYFNSVQFMQI